MRAKASKIFWSDDKLINKIIHMAIEQLAFTISQLTPLKYLTHRIVVLNRTIRNQAVIGVRLNIFTRIAKPVGINSPTSTQSDTLKFLIIYKFLFLIKCIN